MDAYRERVNADRELAVTGRKFSADFGVAFGETRYVIRVREGRIDTVLSSPRFDVRTQFWFRAPLDVWSRFLDPDPPPLYHDVFAMLMRVPEFVIEGDTLAAMQNVRALHRMMNLMREVGPVSAEAVRA